MTRYNLRSKRHADTPGPPADETSAVNTNREEVIPLANRMANDDELGSNPPGRSRSDDAVPKTEGAHLSMKPKSSKKRLRRKKRKEQARKVKETERKPKKKPVLKIATWNVRTMTPGLEGELTDIQDARKMGIIARELSRLNIDIAALQETRIEEEGSHREKEYTFFWKGKSKEERREHGVGFAVNNKLLSMIEEPTGGTERLLTLHLCTTQGSATFVCAYAPTNCSDEEAKDKFYEELDQTLKNVPTNERLYLLGDFNARVGADKDSWSACLGNYGTGKMNDNGQRMLELCTSHNLIITNTMFQMKPFHQVSWRHPRSKRWHQLDLIVARKEDARLVLKTRTFHSADCDTDHSLVGSSIKLKPKKLHKARPPGNPRINSSKATNPKLAKEFKMKIQEALPSFVEGNAEEKWSTIQETVYKQAKDTFGTKKEPSKDWFEDNMETLRPILEKKRNALISHKNNPDIFSKQQLKEACKNSKRSSRRCANDYWINLSQDIQKAADTGNIRGVYDGIKKAVGPAPKKSAPVKDLQGIVIKNKEDQMKRWVEHYEELYSRETLVTKEALDAVESLPCMQELDQEPTMEDLMEAINILPRRKAPVKHGITAEIIRAAKGPLSEHLLDLLQQC